MNIDETTGLPALPEGYFWRVRQGSLYMDHLELRKRIWFGSWKVHERVLPYYDKDRKRLDPKETILRYARSIMGEFHNPWDNFYGDYPPKKLEP